MADAQKKMAAAMAAVSAYLQLEEEQAAGQIAALPQTAAPSQQNQWSQCGRQDMMTMRRLIQLRAFARCR